jgi:hypothetical protein
MEPDSTNPLPAELPPQLPPLLPDALGEAQPSIPWARPAPPPSVRTPTGWDLLIALALIWGFELGGGFGIGVALMVANPGSDPTDVLTQHPVLMLSLSLISLVFAVVVAWYFLCRKYRNRIAEEFALRAVRLRSILVSILLAVGGMLVAVCLIGDQEPGDSPLSQMVSTPLGALAFMAMAVIVPPLEELYYRGFLYSVLKKYTGTVAAVIIVSAWFAGMHAFQLAGEWTGLAIVAVMGTLWTLQRCLTRSLIPSIVTHWLYNAMVVFVAPLLISP